MKPLSACYRTWYMRRERLRKCSSCYNSGAATNYTYMNSGVCQHFTFEAVLQSTLRKRVHIFITICLHLQVWGVIRVPTCRCGGYTGGPPAGMGVYGCPPAGVRVIRVPTCRVRGYTGVNLKVRGLYGCPLQVRGLYGRPPTGVEGIRVPTCRCEGNTGTHLQG